MNETLYLDDIYKDAEIVYTEEELDAIYREYEERVVKKAIFKMWCKENLL